MKLKTLAASAAVLLAAMLALPAMAQNVAVVNGKPVPKARLDMLEAQIKEQAERVHQPVPPDLNSKLKEEVVMREVLMQEAEKRGLQSSPDFLAKLELTRQGLLIQALFADYIKKNPVTDAEAKAEYDRIVASKAAAMAGVKEYKVSHILITSDPKAKDKDKADAAAEAKAAAIIAEIKQGAKFENLAKKESKDTGSGAQGGDLGWAQPSTYVKEFAEAVQKLGKGQMTDTPVKTQFGWHIIRVDDIRDAKAPEPPKFEAVKQQVVQELEQQKLAKFQKDLRDAATVQ